MAKGFDKQPGQQGIGDIGAGVGQAMDQFADLSIGIHMGRNPAATNPFQCEQENAARHIGPDVSGVESGNPQRRAWKPIRHNIDARGKRNCFLSAVK